ncbi:MAG: hypothetical protein JWO79_1891 [Actinomycetia bacterium]|jgi:hypothetical protein|nr:hypothetical protein [Actinomycetes bacterium]MDQ1646117.1 hypothetical protein [Cryptosporangiaceae bacterium]MDQ1651653.1 hypothetical protein [Cryptosporangiaceae bacterium]MDQ1655806.1 hypothetical protein [Cryptosporangiaceae bacterium]
MAYLLRAGNPPIENRGPIQLDRARRVRTTHQRGSGRRCGLCLQSWPCAERSWADRALAPATRLGGRFGTGRWNTLLGWLS